MTENEWLTATDPDPMLDLLHYATSARKLRLFVVACCRHIWDRLPDERGKQAIHVAERFADHLADRKQLHRANLNAYAAERRFGYDTPEHYAAAAARSATENDGRTTASGLADRFHLLPRPARAAFLRDIFGNPFRPVAFTSSWLTADVRGLSTAIYEDRLMPSGHFDNQRMGVLADALEDAGCDHADILDHCRQPSEHVRGCWVLDRVLGKE